MSNSYPRERPIYVAAIVPPSREIFVMEYMLMIHDDGSAMQKATTAQMESFMAAYEAYTTAMVEAGILRAGARLRPVNTATTVRAPEGKAQVVNGPYAELKEQLGGFYIIDVPDLDEAIKWAARCPSARHGALEVRPIWPR